MCAAAIATIRHLTAHNLAHSAQEKGVAFVARLRPEKIAVVRDVRQLGLMIGIELKSKSQPYLLDLMKAGILALPAGPNVIRLLPPLTIPERDLETACDAVAFVLGRT